MFIGRLNYSVMVFGDSVSGKKIIMIIIKVLMQARDTQITEAGFGFSDEICEWKSVCLRAC